MKITDTQHFKAFSEPLLNNNPIFIQMLGICSALAVTSAAENRHCHGFIVNLRSCIFKSDYIAAAECDPKKYPDDCGTECYCYPCYSGR